MRLTPCRRCFASDVTFWFWSRLEDRTTSVVVGRVAGSAKRQSHVELTRALPRTALRRIRAEVEARYANPYNFVGLATKIRCCQSGRAIQFAIVSSKLASSGLWVFSVG